MVCQMEEKEGVELIKEAIDCGYRHFDTALLYHSERIIGQAIREKIADGTVARSDLFITTKVWFSGISVIAQCPMVLHVHFCILLISHLCAFSCGAPTPILNWSSKPVRSRWRT